MYLYTYIYTYCFTCIYVYVYVCGYKFYINIYACTKDLYVSLMGPVWALMVWTLVFLDLGLPCTTAPRVPANSIPK